MQPSPFDGRYGRAEFVSSLIKPGDVGAEIGVAAGVFAYHVLLPSNPSKLFLIDPWQSGIFYRDVVELFRPFSQVEVLRLTSNKASFLFPNEFFDYVYIDGEHSYEAVTDDLNTYFPKVKVGGYLIGDDYGWTGIKEAVQEFLTQHTEEIYWLGDPYMGKTGGQFAIRRIK